MCIYYYLGALPPHRFQIDLIKIVSVTCGCIQRAFSGSNLPGKNRNGPGGRRDKYPLPRNSKSPGADKLPSAHKPGSRAPAIIYGFTDQYIRITPYSIYVRVYLYIPICTLFFSHTHAYFYTHILYRGSRYIILDRRRLAEIAYLSHCPRIYERAREMGFSQTIFFFIPRAKRSASQKSTAGLNIGSRSILSPPPTTANAAIPRSSGSYIVGNGTYPAYYTYAIRWRRRR